MVTIHSRPSELYAHLLYLVNVLCLDAEGVP